MKKNLLLKIIALLPATMVLASCSPDNNKRSDAYVDVTLTYLASPVAGELEQLKVGKGETIKAGQWLYRLDSAPQQFTVDQAQSELVAAKADLANLLYGKRKPELDQIKSEINQAKAQLDYANKQLTRYQRLIKTGAIEQETLDTGLKDAKTAKAKLDQLQAELITAKLASRDEEITAAKAQVDKAQASLQQAKWELAQKTVNSPANGYVFDTYYHVGEQVEANHPVLSILQPAKIKMVFFATSKQLANLRLGQTVTVTTDVDSSVKKARIRYISDQAEYTPPVLYTQKQSAKLVFRVEAVFTEANQGAAFRPGQIVEIHYG